MLKKRHGVRWKEERKESCPRGTQPNWAEAAWGKADQGRRRVGRISPAYRLAASRTSRASTESSQDCVRPPTTPASSRLPTEYARFNLCRALMMDASSLGA